MASSIDYNNTGVNSMEINDVDIVSQTSFDSNKQSVGTTNYENSNESFGLFRDDNYSGDGNLRAVGGGGGGFEDPGGKDNEGAYNDPANTPLGSFPIVLLLCLAVGYGSYRNAHCFIHHTLRYNVE
jgi:hypothetical protein